MQSACPLSLFPQHSLIKPRQRPNPGSHQHPHTAPRNTPRHNPRARARAPFPHIHDPRRDRLHDVETDGIVPALPLQVDEPAPEQGQEDARQEPEADGAPESGREQGEEIGGFDGEVGRPERGDGGEGRQVVERQDFAAEAIDLDAERKQFDAGDRAQEAPHAVEGGGQRGVGDIIRDGRADSGGVNVYLVREDGRGWGQGYGARKGKGAVGRFC